MSQWSEPFTETKNYKTKSGKDFQVTRTYCDLYSSRPFQPPDSNAAVIHRQLLNIEVSGDISEEEASEILEDLKKIERIISKMP
jgi:hypothetical protein